MLLVAGCGISAIGDTDHEPAGARVQLRPGDQARAVDPATPIEATVRTGRFQDVALTGPDGQSVPGQVAPDGKSWTVTAPLGYDTVYTWSGTAVGDDGKPTPLRGSFTTARPESLTEVTISPSDGAEVGVAMPIAVKFDQPVRDKASVERALEVDTSVPVEGAWAWLSDTQVDWRPKEYWPAHTEVTVRAGVYGVPHGDGAYGAHDASSTFNIGRSQVVKADVNSHELVVERDGEEPIRYPASYGRPSDSNLHTANGIYVAMAKLPVEMMSNPEYGYVDQPMKWAVRMSNHGEYIHANDANGNIGSANTTHGCINLSTSDAKEYFDSALVGDPIEVTGSSSDMEPGYDIYDWLLPWEQWQQKSAL